MRLLPIKGSTTEAITARSAAAVCNVAPPGSEIVSLTVRRGPRVTGTRAENARLFSFRSRKSGNP
jgi:hypothetical protein